ncbi:MAG: hypothetical protein ACE5K7_02465, partial [Phycisphaerae bacterium]
MIALTVVAALCHAESPRRGRDNGVLPPSGPDPARQVRFVCTRDVWVSAIAGGGAVDERNTSMGKTPRLKLKSIQEMALLDFDLSSLKGKLISGGYLYFHVVPDPQEVGRFNLPMQRKHLLRRIGLSTVSSDWQEGQATRHYTIDKVGFGATFLEASYSRRPWAYPGSDLTDVTMGNGQTLQSHAELEDLPDMWVRLKVPAYMIQALITRDGFGWCIMDELGQGLANNFIHSREARGYEPYLLVNVVGTDSVPPAAPKLTVRPAPTRAHLSTGAIAIELEGAPETFCFFVKVNGRDVPRWLVPHPRQGRTRIIVDDLEPAENVVVEAVAADPAGNRSATVRARGKASAALQPPPALPAVWKPSPARPPVRSGRLRVWAFPEVCKVDPVSGELFDARFGKAGQNADAMAYQRANSAWDGASNTVRLFGARGEIVAFQLCLQRTRRDEPLKGIAVALDSLTSGKARIGPRRIKLFRIWYVKKMAEYAVPLRGGQAISIPAEDNRIPGQTNQAIYVDIAVPQDAPAGVYRGSIAISADGVEPFELPVTLRVYDFAIPDRLRFNPELNIYRSPGPPGSEVFYAAYRLAHYNRCTLSITQSGHSDRVKTPLPIEGTGANVRVKDWSQYDRAFGPLLDGSAFADLPRAGTPLATFHIPLSHGYPLPVDRYYDYDGPKHGRDVAFVHALLCKPIEQAFSQDYQKGFMSFARQFVEHAEQKGWTRTQFMFYLDAKPKYRQRGSGTSYWTLDEPYNYDDWMALKFWGKLFHKGIAGAVRNTHFAFRCDISRPQWTRNWLYGVCNYMYVGGIFPYKARRCQIMAEQGPMVLYWYGSCNRPEQSHWN